MDWKLEVVIVPVSDVDRAKSFYVDKLGFALDVDHRAGDSFRVVQTTPPGSACSITFGVGLSSSAPGTYQGMTLVVADIEKAHAFLVERGVDPGEVHHFKDGQRAPGPDPERAAFNSFVDFRDPDGNTWVVQEHDPARSSA